MIGMVESRAVIAERESADAGDASDSTLVDRFVATRQQEAFAELVRRHGPVVLGVCNRVLENRDDAQDAFQITFMVLATRASSLKHPDRLGNWLYGVAFRVARRARTAARRRRNVERSGEHLSEIRSVRSLRHASDNQVLIDDEIDHLPPQYRAALVAVYIEGRTNREAARALGWPEGTLVTRLNRARVMLRERVAATGADGALRPRLSRAIVPAAWIAATVKLASGHAAGHSMVLLTRVHFATLFKSFAKAGAFAKGKGVGILLISASTACAGAGFWVMQKRAVQPVTDVVRDEPRAHATITPAAAPAYPRSLNGIRPAMQVVPVSSPDDRGSANRAKMLPAIYGFTDNAGTASDLRDAMTRASAAAAEHRAAVAR